MIDGHHDHVTTRRPGSRLLQSIHAALLALFVAGLPVLALAQDVVGIIAVVNDDIITDHNLEQRLRLAVSTAGLADTLEVRARLTDQVLRSLIDEALQIQEAARLNVGVTPFEMEEAKRLLENQNGVPAGGLSRFLAEQGVDEPAVLSQVEAEISWTKVINTAIAGQVDISDEEIDEVLARFAASEGQFRVLLSEIFMEVDTPGQAGDVVAELERLSEDIQSGAAFSAVARQFSQGSSAYQGGDVGWALVDQLQPEIAAAVSAMEVGALSSPIASTGGYYLLFLRDRRVVGALDPRDIQIHLMQVALPLAEGATPPDVARALARAESISTTIRGCEQMAAMIDEVGTPESGDLGVLRLGDMPSRFSDAVANLAVGQPSAPVRSEVAVHVFMACDRQDPVPNLPDRNDVANSLWDQRLDILSRRYLRDLRQNAIIDLR